MPTGRRILDTELAGPIRAPRKDLPSAGGEGERVVGSAGDLLAALHNYFRFLPSEIHRPVLRGHADMTLSILVAAPEPDSPLRVQSTGVVVATANQRDQDTLGKWNELWDAFRAILRRSSQGAVVVAAPGVGPSVCINGRRVEGARSNLDHLDVVEAFYDCRFLPLAHRVPQTELVALTCAVHEDDAHRQLRGRGSCHGLGHLLLPCGWFGPIVGFDCVGDASESEGHCCRER
mmetsp:Transcript_41185/g.88930  ORF Transcript_41185/g.88930 Transcript_41185/m.88930 type:complete len:233 (-) Transcript_41185:7-705(-)